MPQVERQDRRSAFDEARLNARPIDFRCYLERGPIQSEAPAPVAALMTGLFAIADAPGSTRPTSFSAFPTMVDPIFPPVAPPPRPTSSAFVSVSRSDCAA